MRNRSSLTIKILESFFSSKHLARGGFRQERWEGAAATPSLYSLPAGDA